MNHPDVKFPNLGIDIDRLNAVAFRIFGIPIYWYGILICLGIIAGLLLAMHVAKKTGQDKDMYMDVLVYCLVCALIGARLYYVAFEWNEFKDNPADIILDIRGGGLAIYGGVIGAIVGGIIYSKVKKKNFWLIADTGVVGLLLGQAIGRWGNFFNMEAFGGNTNNLFAMALRVESENASYIPPSLETQVYNGVEYLQVHPTFLYEFLWCLGVMLILLFYTKRKKFDGEIFFLYFIGYGLGRFWIEGLRTDQLFLWNTNIPISQLLSAVMVVISLAYIIYKRARLWKGSSSI